MAGMLIYINHIYRIHIVGDFAAYPEPVAQKLRRAIYYTNMDLQPRKALKYYQAALRTAAELGMDPFSEEIMGVKTQMVALFEKAGAWKNVVELLELIREDCKGWVEEHEADILGDEEGKGALREKRTRVLGKAIQISMKLGEVYGNDFVREKEAAEESLVWGVTAVLKEKKRREEDGVREGEGQWLDDEQIGAALESEFDRPLLSFG